MLVKRRGGEEGKKDNISDDRKREKGREREEKGELYV